MDIIYHNNLQFTRLHSGINNNIFVFMFVTETVSPATNLRALHTAAH